VEAAAGQPAEGTKMRVWALPGLVKVSPDGNTIESAGQESGYPQKVEPVTSPSYGIAYRQK